MSLLLSPDALADRRRIAGAELAGLADSLATELRPLLAQDIYIPENKALLSREGGRCPVHGASLEFDPWSPHDHRCPVDGARFRGDLHDRFWTYWHHLWLAERSVHAALLHLLRGDARHAELAARILDAYSDRYLRYPNADNVLGPTRPFFSTYIESIWLLQLCVAIDLLEAASDGVGTYRQLGGRVRERLIEPSLALIESYDEGMSNRQVWNNAARMAGNHLLGRPELVEAAVFGTSGLVRHLTDAVLSDGTWYEGENYHLFAHRGLWYGTTMAERQGITIPAGLDARFREGFATPFVVSLPDFTLPARRDSQFGISLRQWRFADSCELGLARGDDDRLLGALARLYADDIPVRDTGRWRSTAEAERNEPAARLTRADLGWRSLLFAREVLPVLEAKAAASVVLEGQGLAILRRDAGRMYVALDYGHSGGGHGHADRLNVLLADGGVRWLDDMGTGSYVDPSLHWYRSTLAHNAPLVDGRSQWRVHGRLLAFSDRSVAGWAEAEAEIADGVTATRTIVATSDYVLDVLSWEASRDVVVDLPFHVDADAVDDSVRFESAALTGADGLEDGFSFVRDAERAAVGTGRVVRMRARAGAHVLDLWMACSRALELWRCVAPGPPGVGDRRFLLLRTNGTSGQISILSSVTGRVLALTPGEELSVTLAAGVTHQHQRQSDGWQVRIDDGALSETVELGRKPDVASDRDAASRREAASSGERAAITLIRGATVEIALSEAHYRRSEQSWTEADRPSATVGIWWREGVLAIRIAAHRVERSFVPPDQTNPYDNEHADVNGAGAQVYVGTRANDVNGWMLVPIAGTADVSIRPIVGWAGVASPTITAHWEALPDGYQIDAEIAAADALRVGAQLWLDVIVNEKPVSRVRRRGQLVMSGGAGEFVYLRGDRHDRERFLGFNLRDV